MVRFAAANRDAAQYRAPDTLDVRRRNAGTHLAFGAGIHHCLGAALAREEMNAAFAYLIPRLEAPHMLAANDFEHHPSLLLRGLKRLWIGFAPRR